MICPKCRSQKTQHIDHGKNAFLCIECNYSWKPENGAKEPKGNLSFNGIPEAKQIFEALTKGQDFTPEFRAALETQITAILFDQWFNGMKTGQMASILYAKEHYGKNRDDSTGTDSSCGGRTSGTQRPGQDRRVRREQDTANPGAKEISQTVTERVNGGVLKYPRGLRIPDNMFTEIAKMNDELPGFIKRDYFWDGHKLTVQVDW